jgi:tetratricopeptide (TPR) repeat protein
MTHFYLKKSSDKKKIILVILLSIIAIIFTLRVFLYLQEKKREKQIVQGSKKTGEIIKKSREGAREKIRNSFSSNIEQKEEKKILTVSEPKKKQLEGSNNFQNSKNIREANFYFKQGNFKRAIKLYLKVEPKSFQVLKSLGLSYFNTGSYSQAATILGEAVSKNSKDFKVLKYLGLSYCKEEDFTNALKWIELALQIGKDKELAYARVRTLKEKKNRKYYGVNKRVNFRITYSKLAHSRDETEIVSILESAYRDICGSLNFYPDDVTEVVLYTQKSFFDITRVPGWVGGLFDGRIRLPVKDITADQFQDLRRIIYHEYVHALVHKITSTCPTWLNEGLAEYFSQQSYVQTIGQIIPLEYLETSFPNKGKAVAVAYLESYSVVKYLIDRYGMYRVISLLKKLGEKIPFHKGFESEYMVSYQRFLAEWGRNE